MSQPTAANAATWIDSVPGPEKIYVKNDRGEDVDTGRFAQIRIQHEAWGSWEIHVYDGPRGTGYIRIIHANNYTYREHVGPEIWRDAQCGRWIKERGGD